MQPQMEAVFFTLNKDLFYIEDNTNHGDTKNPVDKRDRGYWVMMRESNDSSMIIFTGLREEVATQFKDRFEKAFSRWKNGSMGST